MQVHPLSVQTDVYNDDETCSQLMILYINIKHILMTLPFAASKKEEFTYSLILLIRNMIIHQHSPPRISYGPFAAAKNSIPTTGAPALFIFPMLYTKLCFCREPGRDPCCKRCGAVPLYGDDVRGSEIIKIVMKSRCIILTT